MKLGRTLALLVPAGPIALAVACNGILGIDPPVLVPGDASLVGTGDGSPSSDAMVDSTAMDGAIDGTTTPDASVDSSPEGSVTMGDASRDGGFDGNCTCTSDACAPVLIADNQTSPTRLALDSTSVYWTTTSSTGTIMRANLDGTHVTTLASALLQPLAITVSDGFVYWTELQAGDVRKCAVASCTPEVLAAGLSDPAGLGLFGSDLYWTSSNTQRVDWLNLLDDAGGIQVLSGKAQSPVSLAVDATNVYWTGGTGGIYACPRAGCPVSDASAPLFAPSPSPVRITSDGTTVYWTDDSAGAIYSCPATGLGQPTLLFSTAETPSGIAVDSSHIYVTTTSSVLRATLAGTSVTVIASQGNPDDVAISDSCVYWTDDGLDAGNVYASPK